MMEQVRLCAVWPRENWLGSSLNQIQGWTPVQEFYSRALEQGSLLSWARAASIFGLSPRAKGKDFGAYSLCSNFSLGDFSIGHLEREEGGGGSVGRLKV